MKGETKEFSIQVIKTRVEKFKEQLRAIEESQRFNHLSPEQKLLFLKIEIQTENFLESLNK